MMSRIDSARALFLAGAAFAFVIPTAASAQTAEQTTAEAQDAPPAPEATGAANDEGQDSAVGEVVVTARRTEESLQKVPSAISTFNERALDRIQASDSTALQGAVPNLNIVQGRGSSNATNIFLRGVGQPDALQTFDPAVGVYIDDVYLSRIRGNQMDLLDLERVEVLRGPQGTLYGKNTIGGALKFVTRRPGKTFRANGSLTVGNHDALELKAAVSGPISETVSAGVAVLRSKRDGFVEDEVLDRDYNDKDTFGVRGALAFTPYSNLRIDLTADYSKDDAALNVGRPLNNLTTFSGGVLVVDNPATKYDWKGRTTPGLPNSTKLKHYGFSSTIATDITDALTLKVITSYRNLKTDDYIDIDATQYEIGDVFVGVSQNQLSEEVQLNYTTDRLKAVAGLYYLDERVKSHQEAYADDLLGPLFLNSGFLRTIDDDLKTKSYAGYANASFEVVPSVHVSGGIRFTRETKDYFRTTSTFYSLLPGFNGTYLFNPAKAGWNDTSPMLSVDWSPTKDSMVYARFAKGFKSGGFNGRANSVAASTEYDPETVKSYEAGFKTSWGSALRINGAVFHNDYRDFQARVSGEDTDPITGFPSPKLSVLNAGKLRIRGAELEAAWTPLDGLLFDTQVGYLKAKYREFDDARFTLFDGSRAFQTPAFSPKWTARIGAQYAFDLAGAGGITIGGQSRYKSRTALAVDNTPVNSDAEIAGLFQGSYWVHDARLVYETEGKRFAIGVYGQNLANRRYKTDGQEFSTIGSIRTVYYGNPRTVSLRLTARY